MLRCPLFRFAQPVALALILVTPCDDDSVRYYSTCGSGRTNLGARVVLFVPGYAASQADFNVIISLVRILKRRGVTS